MTTKDFKIWLIQNGYNAKTLAIRLGITPETISRYNSIGRYPVLFILALKGLEAIASEGKAE